MSMNIGYHMLRVAHVGQVIQTRISATSADITQLGNGSIEKILEDSQLTQCWLIYRIDVRRM